VRDVEGLELLREFGQLMREVLTRVEARGEQLGGLVPEGAVRVGRQAEPVADEAHVIREES